MIRALIRATWTYRGFIASTVKREFAIRYAGTSAGAAWLIVQPIALVLVFTLVLGDIMKARLPGQATVYGYGIYVLSGLLFWSLFSEIMTRLANIFPDNANLIKKVAFPRICLPASAIASAMISNGILFVLTLGSSLIFHSLNWNVLPLLFLVTLGAILFSAGLGILLATINVFVRDVAAAVPIALQFLFWLTPIVYLKDIVPKSLVSLLLLNPMAAFVDCYQSILYFGKSPSLESALVAGVAAIVSPLVGYAAFLRADAEIIDAL